MTAFSADLEARVRSNRARFELHSRPDPALKHAAVAATLVGDDAGCAARAAGTQAVAVNPSGDRVPAPR